LRVTYPILSGTARPNEKSARRAVLVAREGGVFRAGAALVNTAPWMSDQVTPAWYTSRQCRSHLPQSEPVSLRTGESMRLGSSAPPGRGWGWRPVLPPPARGDPPGGGGGSVQGRSTQGPLGRQRVGLGRQANPPPPAPSFL